MLGDVVLIAVVVILTHPEPDIAIGCHLAEKASPVAAVHAEIDAAQRHPQLPLDLLPDARRVYAPFGRNWKGAGTHSLRRYRQGVGTAEIAPRLGRDHGKAD